MLDSYVHAESYLIKKCRQMLCAHKTRFLMPGHKCLTIFMEIEYYAAGLKTFQIIKFLNMRLLSGL